MENRFYSSPSWGPSRPHKVWAMDQNMNLRRTDSRQREAVSKKYLSPLNTKHQPTDRPTCQNLSTISPVPCQPRPTLLYLIPPFPVPLCRVHFRAPVRIPPHPLEQSSSSLDPTFWPMHGTMERMYQFGVVTGTINEFTWPDKDMTVTLPDGTSYTQYVSSRYEECNGHHGSHIFPYGLLGSDVDGFKVKTGIRSNPATGNNLTNREVLAAFDPRSNSMNYVYDTFKWDHCVPEGYDFDDAWGEKSPSPRKNFYERDEPRSPVYTSFKRMMAELMKEEGDRLKEKEREASSG